MGVPVVWLVARFIPVDQAGADEGLKRVADLADRTA